MPDFALPPQLTPTIKAQILENRSRGTFPWKIVESIQKTLKLTNEQARTLYLEAIKDSPITSIPRPPDEFLDAVESNHVYAEIKKETS